MEMHVMVCYVGHQLGARQEQIMEGMLICFKAKKKKNGVSRIKFDQRGL